MSMMPSDSENRLDLPARVNRPEAHYAGMQAARNMPSDWYCPRRSFSLPRRDCVECVAEVALDAALAYLFGDD